MSGRTMFSLGGNDRLVIERFLGKRGGRVSAEVDEYLLSLENVAILMGNGLSEKTSALQDRRPFVIGVGADFQEFSVPLIRAMASDKRVRVGCLWPYPSVVKPSQEPLIFFNQEYVEKDPAPSDVIVISQSFVFDKNQVEAVVERAMELKKDLPMILVCAVATGEVVTHFQSLIPGLTSVLSAILVDPNRVALDYWELEKLLDRRETRIVPRLAKCLLDRLDANEGELDRYPWVPQREHYGWPPARAAVW